jgi:hypothetical protein
MFSPSTTSLSKGKLQFTHWDCSFLAGNSSFKAGVAGGTEVDTFFRAQRLVLL